MSCRHVEDSVLLLVDATRALLSIAQALLRVAPVPAAGNGGRGGGSKKATAGGSRSHVVEVAGRAWERAVGVVGQILGRMPHSATVVEFLLEFLELEGSGSGGGAVGGTRLSESLTFAVAVKQMEANLLTADEQLRRATLRLWLHLLAPAADAGAAGGGERGYDLFGGDSDRAVVEVMLAVEEAPMDATHGKARILKLEQLHTAVETRKVPEALLGAVFAFYVGQLRCRFTLPWKAVRKGLSAMAQHSPRHLWPGLLAHISIAAGSRNFSSLRPDDAQKEDGNVGGEELGGAGPAAAEDEGAGVEEVQGMVKKRRGKGEKKVAGVPKAVRVCVGRTPPGQRMRCRLEMAARSREFSGTPQLDVLVQLLQVGKRREAGREGGGQRERDSALLVHICPSVYPLSPYTYLSAPARASMNGGTVAHACRPPAGLGCVCLSSVCLSSVCLSSVCLPACRLHLRAGAHLRLHTFTRVMVAGGGGGRSLSAEPLARCGDAVHALPCPAVRPALRRRPRGLGGP